MLALKRGMPPGEPGTGPERQKTLAFKRAAAVLSAAAVSVALASGCGATLAEGGPAITMPLRPRPSVHLLDWPRVPEATDESLESFERQLETGDGHARRDALFGISHVYSNAGSNRELRERCFEILLRAVKTGVDSDDSALAVLLVSRLSLLNSDFTYSQRMQAADLLISALRSEAPGFWHQQAANAVPTLSFESAARLAPKEIDSFIEMNRLLLLVSGNSFGLVAANLESISHIPQLSGEQINQIRIIFERQLLFPALLPPSGAERLPSSIRILAVLATNPNTPDVQAQRIRMQIGRFLDYQLPEIRGSARFYLAYISMGNKCASDQELAESAALLLKSREDSASHGLSVPERLLTVASAHRNPVYLRRNAYRVLRSYVMQGGMPQGFPSEQILRRTRSALILERDHSVRAEAKALLSIIPQP